MGRNKKKEFNLAKKNINTSKSEIWFNFKEAEEYLRHHNAWVNLSINANNPLEFNVKNLKTKI